MANDLMSMNLEVNTSLRVPVDLTYAESEEK
jgi:hypothetical protein